MLRRSVPSICFTICVFLSQSTMAQKPSEESYPVHPDSVQKPGVPEGDILSGNWTGSTVFPGTVRDYWIYVPKQYDGTKPAALMVFQDGGGSVKRNGGANVPNVLDNLIHSGEMPVTIGLFISPGVVPAVNEKSQPRFNRSFEYDSVDDRYAKFLLDEFIPSVS